MTAATEKLFLSWIRRDGGTQVRACLDQSTVEKYRENYVEGVAMPPPIVFNDGSSHWLADGFQRCEAAEQAGLRELECEVRVGTQRDARLYACGANAEHGLPRSSQDKRRAVETLLADDEWKTQSTNWMAEQAKVSHAFVVKVRTEYEAIHGGATKRVGKDGVTRSATKQKSTDELLAREVTADEPESATEPESPVLQMPDEPVFDHFDAPVPPEIIPAYMTGKELRTAATAIAKLKSTVERLARADGGDGFHLQTVTKALDQATETIRRGAFYVVCPECEGLAGECKTCKSRHWLSDSQFGQLGLGQKKKCERHQRKRA